MRGENTKEPLVKCVTLNSDETLRKTAIEKHDEKIIATLSRELVAAEGHYHRSCYRDYTRKGKDKESGDLHEVDEYFQCETASLDLLYQYIRCELIEHPKVVRMIDLTNIFIEHMKSMGVHEIRESAKKHLRRKIELEFGNTLVIFPDDTGKLCVCPESLSKLQLAKNYVKLQNELSKLKSMDQDKRTVVQKAALYIRTDIKSGTNKTSWPPKISELNETCPSLPSLLKLFFQILLTGDAEAELSTKSTERIERLTNSFSQDIIHSVTYGKHKMPKHILLPYAVKSLTGNVELIQMLNRLGHGLSYSQIEELDTALCLQKMAMTEAESVPLPEANQPFIFTTLAWDNIDRLEETLSGGGTSHRVNGIVVQPRVFGPSPAPPSMVENKSRRRSIEATEIHLPVYNAGERVGPPHRHCVEVSYTDIQRESWRKNLIWLLVRLHANKNQPVCSWTGFKVMVRSDTSISQDQVGYLPTINAPATSLSTVHEVLVQSLKIRETLQLPSIVVVFDQALYAKATEILWKHPNRFQNVIPRLGVFHTICTMLSIIGKRFMDAGLRDICIESGVIAEGSVGGVLEGRKYNRAIRFHKLLYEALLRLTWKAFPQWLETQSVDSSILERITDVMKSLSENVCQSKFDEVMKDPTVLEFEGYFHKYRGHLRSGQGKLASFWMSYIDMVEVVLDLIRASREGLWKLHLSAVHSMIPWCFAYNRMNYARYLPVYLSEMSRLHEDHPEVFQHFQDGGFSVQIGPKNPFGRIPVDQTCEETVNKDTQTPGGTKGFSLKPGAVSRYYITAEFRSTYLRVLRDMVHLNQSELQHADLQQSRIKRDEQDVQALMEMLETNWINPFNHEQQELISISTGKAAPPEVAKDLIGAYDTGKTAFELFKTERLEKIPPLKKFHDTIPQQKLRTFSDMNKTKRVREASGKEIILKADRNLFAHMVIIAQSRKLEMKEVLAHPLGPLPWALAASDGSLRKTAKSALANHLQKDTTAAEVIPEPCASIVDGMAQVQKIKGDHKTFGEVSISIFNTILHECSKSKRIDVVFDVYREESIKNAERANRGTGGTQFKNIVSGHRLQQWRKFLSNTSNKSCLIRFLSNEWQKDSYRNKLGEKELFVASESVCYKLTRTSYEETQELSSTQEEADTRLLLHAAHAGKCGYKAIIIHTEDTDVFIMSLAFSRQIAIPLYLKCGTKGRTRFIAVQQVVHCIGESLCESLIGFHAFTGCDTVSAFAGRGKIAALKILKRSNSYQDTFKELGRDWDMSKDLSTQLEAFTCEMYHSKAGTEDINDLRYRLFCAKQGEVDSH